MTGIMLQPHVFDMLTVLPCSTGLPLSIYNPDVFFDGVPGPPIYAAGRDPEIQRLKDLLDQVRIALSAVNDDYDGAETAIDDIREVLARE